MDKELLIALFVLWASTTAALIVFLSMWFNNDGEAFHPHSVDVEHRHSLFLVVSSETMCKTDCAVKSISVFVAPRGSSSSKHFTVLIVMVAVAGFLGSSRWYFVGDASVLEAALSLTGFASLLLVANFELDVVSERFLEDKLMITWWLIEKLKMDHLLPFRPSILDERFLHFIRNSPDIYYLYDEDFGWNQNKKLKQKKLFSKWNYNYFWLSGHLVGATTYIACVTASVFLNDLAEEKVAWITGITFGIFCLLGYLTGTYLPVLPFLRGWVLTWNPFVREPNFMYKLQKAVQKYSETNSMEPDPKIYSIARKRSKRFSSDGMISRSNSLQLTRKNDSKDNVSNSVIDPNDKLLREEFKKADDKLDSYFLRFARKYPLLYLKILSYLLVMTELVAMYTPAIAMGIQWVTALCDGPPLLAIIDLWWLGTACLLNPPECDHAVQNLTHCILK